MVQSFTVPKFCTVWYYIHAYVYVHLFVHVYVCNLHMRVPRFGYMCDIYVIMNKMEACAIHFILYMNNYQLITNLLVKFHSFTIACIDNKWYTIDPEIFVSNKVKISMIFNFA